MLRSETVKKIEEFVYSKPCSIQEIAQAINKNWRTADRYVQEIEKEFGTISTRTFRGGTRGALKIVYWSAVEKISKSVFQEQLEKEIFNAKQKNQFSAFDLYQHVADKKKKAIVEHVDSEELTDIISFDEFISQTTKQLLLFSGNLSFINLKQKNHDLFATLESLVKKGIGIKIICRVDMGGKNNIEKMLSLNLKYGQELVEIHHREQPVRGAIRDDTLLRLKEIQEPTGKVNELSTKNFIFYTITDREWVGWMRQIFWHMFSSSIDVYQRLTQINALDFFNKK